MMHAHVHKIRSGATGCQQTPPHSHAHTLQSELKENFSREMHVSSRADGLQEALYKVHVRVHETEDGLNGPPANATIIACRHCALVLDHS